MNADGSVAHSRMEAKVYIDAFRFTRDSDLDLSKFAGHILIQDMALSRCAPRPPYATKFSSISQPFLKPADRYLPSFLDLAYPSIVQF